MQEKYPELTTYCYTYGNPISYIDPDGNDGRVAIKGQIITISVNIHIYGSGATNKVAETMQRDIMNYWGKNPDTGQNWTYSYPSTKKDYTVLFDVKVDLYNPQNPKEMPGLFSGKNNPFNRDNYIEVSHKSTRSYVESGDEGLWRSTGRNGKSLSEDDPSVHEFGHLLGFRDRYTDENGIMKGWEGNIMAEPVMKGKVEQRNIDALLQPIMKKYNKSNHKAQSEYKTSINYDTMKYYIMKNYLSLFVWLLISIPLYISCNNNVIEINGVYSDEDIENRMGIPDFVRVIVLKPDSSLSLYEYQNGLYQFIPNKDSLIVFEQIYKTGFKKKIIWLTEYEKKKRVLDILEYDTLKTHF